MNYWVIKGNPKWYDWDRFLRAGREENWHGRFANQELKLGDRVFLWESGSKRRIIGFASVTRPYFGKDKDGLWMFRVRYLTGRLQWMPGIDYLRSVRNLRSVSFLNPGVFGTVYPLTETQGRTLYASTVAGNPQDHIWREIVDGAPTTGLPDVDLAAREGNPKLVTHLLRERAPWLARAKKEQFRSRHGKLFCECCNSDGAIYGSVSDAIFEVHHRRALGMRKRASDTPLKDMAILCPNCHRAIHRIDPMISVEALRRRIAN